MLKTLTRIQLKALASTLFAQARSRKKAASPWKTLVFALLILYCVAVVAVMFGAFFAQLAAPCHAMGLDWLYFVLAALACFTLMVVGSVFMAKSLLYEARDNDLLLAMPIPPAAILGSRMVVLWLYSGVFGLAVALPAALVWAQQVGFGVAGAVAFVLLFAALPLPALALSGLLGWLLAKLGSHVRNKTLFTTLFSLVFLGAYFALYTRVFSYIQQLVSQLQTVAQGLSAAAPLLWLGRAAADGHLPSLLGALLCEVVPFALLYWLLSATFIKTATARRGAAHVTYHEKVERQRSIEAALLAKESKRFFSSSAYMLNAGLGLVFLLAGAVLGLVQAPTLRQLLATLPPDMAALPGPLLALALCAMQSMILISAPSLSLEGRSLWLPQSLPITSQQCLAAKVRLHLLLAAPVTLLAALVLGAVLQLPLPQLVLGAVCGVLACWWCATLGVMMDLCFPRFDWVNEMMAVKQAVGVLMTMLIGFLVTVAVGLPYLLWLQPLLAPTAYLAVLAAVLLALCIGGTRWLRTAGARRFAALAG